MIWEGTITTPKVIYNFPVGREEVRVYTDADITIEFWMGGIKAYGDPVAVVAPGSFVGVCGSQGRITGAANVTIL
jgi:hypothetical protein